MQFTISARGKASAIPIQKFIKENYSHIPLEQIDSFYGFTEASTLYGGRIFTNTELSRYDVRSMYGMNINVRLPLTNHHASPEEYEEKQSFVEKYHRVGNSLSITNDVLAVWIRKDFPGCPKRFEAVYPSDYDDCACGRTGISVTQVNRSQVRVSLGLLRHLSPTGSLQRALKRGEDLQLSVDNRGQFYFGGNLVPFQQLLETIREAHSEKMLPPPKNVNGDWLVTIRVPIELPEDSPVLATRLAEVESQISEIGGRSWVQGSE